ncbi:MAG: AAA family ATPase [Cyclobacteriaceae bacterium]
MILGLFVRHYKCYSKLNFLSFTTNFVLNKFKLIIGNNGTGKSSILEALNVYFNKGTFILTTGEKWQEAFVAPIFLFEKSIIDKIWSHCFGNIKKKEVEEITQKISNHLWQLQPPKNSRPQELFTNLKNTFKGSHQDDFFLVIDGIDFEGNTSYGPLDQLFQLLKEVHSERILKQYSNALRASFGYVYIPVETSINDYLRLEGEGIQQLMDTDVKKTIDSIFQEQVEKEGKQTSLIEYLNSTLINFVSEIEANIQKIEADYSFRPDHAVKQKVTPKDLRGEVINEFFKNRKLKRGLTKIENLSSGQRKKALVDIIYSLIQTNNDRPDRELIIAIDEPEASLHVNNCFEQFEKLMKISGFGIQTLVTSHWYGAIPILENGTLIHCTEVEGDAPKLNSFDSSNIYDNHGLDKIDDIAFKSLYDLASSLLASIRYGNKHWLIVEGHSDKKYLETYFDPLKVKILNIGGIDNIIDLVDFLSIPLNKKKEKKESNNKIVFLSDNDREYKLSLANTNTVLHFQRYIAKEEKVELVDYSEKKYGSVLGIEDVMDSRRMWKALVSLASKEKGLLEAINPFEIEGDFSISQFSGDYSFLKCKLTGKPKVGAIKKLSETLKPLKTRLAIEYKNVGGTETIAWIEGLKKLLA